jgi:hypothetical protein
MQFRLLDRHAIQEWHEAVGSLPPIRVAKNGTINLITKEGINKGSIPFARWEDMDAVLRPMLDAVGLFLTFDAVPRPGDGGGLIVTGSLRHRSGHSVSASMPLAIDTGAGRNNLQAMGSTLSYGKRYAAEMLLNIIRVGDDDDGKLGGTKFITEEQADELRSMAKEIGRQEGPLLDSFFAGSVRTFEEIEDGQAYLAMRNGLLKRVADKRKEG